jgi:parallel beta-helix repeat protein
MNYIYDKNLLEGLVIDNRGRVSGISIYSGVIMVSNVNITMGYLNNLNKIVVIGLYCDNSIVFLNSVIIKGHHDIMTVGCLAYQANLKVINSKFYQNKFAGFLTHSTSTNFINLNKNIINENLGCGIFICGDGETILEDNLIEKNQGVGLKIVDCRKLSFVNNIIVENFLNGAEFINCDGLIMLNSFYNNRGIGCLLETQNEGFFLAKVFKNSIIENSKAGLVIKGAKNKAIIEQNQQIGFNNFSGIHISDEATPKIINNVIFENMHQGILDVTGSSAIIKGNEIRENIRANIAFGGKMSEFTIISENKIIGSRNEGIFIIDSDGGVIENNDILENNDGIILMRSKNTEIRENMIEGNLRCGMLLIQSFPIVSKNHIFENQFIGVFFKENSGGNFWDNSIKSNVCCVYLNRGCDEIEKDIIGNNEICGRIEKQKLCTIF